MTDIIEIDQSFDASKIINKLTVIGAGPGGTHLEVTVEDPESQAKYGVMEGVFSEKDIHDSDTLTSFANAALAQTVEAKHRMLAKLMGTERTDIEVGDIVHVTYSDAGIDGDYRIISMERTSGVDGDYTKLELAVPQFRVTETIADVGRRADAEDYHPQGAPSIIPQHESDNVDSTHPLVMKFYIPPEAVDMGKLQIKEARVALTLEAFRAYSTGAASGGGQTSGASSSSTTASGGGQTSGASSASTTAAGGGQTSSAGAAHSHSVSGQTAENAGSHRHLMFRKTNVQSWSDPSYKVTWNPEDSTPEAAIIVGSTVSLPVNYLSTYGESGSHTHSITTTTSASESAHTHTISNHTHGMEHTHQISNHTHGMAHTHEISNHTHDIVYGIYESTSPSNVYIKLNGTSIAGPFNADEYVDITTEFLDQITTYGWNTLEFTTAQLGKIGATLFMRLFLQAG